MTAQLATKALRVEDIYDEADEEERLKFLLEAAYRRVLRDVHLIVTEAFDIEPSTFRLPDDAATAWAREQAAARVSMISATTREALRDLIADAIDEGLATSEVIERIQSLYLETWPGRAETIARTEIAEAQRLSAIDRYKASGLVDRVKIRDGEDDAPCAQRNGTTVPLDEAPELAHPNCLVGGQVVFAPNVEAASTRWFDGEVVVIRTAANDFLTVTPNHPVLTGRGWVAAQFVNEGDHVLRCTDGERIARLTDPDHDHRPALIEQIADSFGPTGGMASASVPGTTEDFHGDGSEGDVNIVWTDGFARDGIARQHRQHIPLDLALVGAGAFLADGSQCDIFRGALTAPDGIMGGSGNCLSELGRAGTVDQTCGSLAVSDFPTTVPPSLVQVGREQASLIRQSCTSLTSEIAIVERAESGIVGAAFGNAARHDMPTELMESLTQHLVAHPDSRRDLSQRLASLVTPTRVCEVFRRPFAGHVYNLQTKQEWYVAENIITHNCTLILVPLLREGVV